MKPEIGWQDCKLPTLFKATVGTGALLETTMLLQQAVEFFLNPEQPELVFTPEVTYRNGQVAQKVVLHGRLTNWTDPVEISDPPEVSKVTPSFFQIGGQSADPKILFSGRTADGQLYYLYLQSVRGENHYFLKRDDLDLDLGKTNKVSVSSYVQQAFTWDDEQSMLVDLTTGEIVDVTLPADQIQSIFAEWSSLPDDELPGVEAYVLMALFWVVVVAWLVKNKTNVQLIK